MRMGFMAIGIILIVIGIFVFFEFPMLLGWAFISVGFVLVFVGLVADERTTPRKWSVKEKLVVVAVVIVFLSVGALYSHITWVAQGYRDAFYRAQNGAANELLLSLDSIGDETARMTNGQHSLEYRFSASLSVLSLSDSIRFSASELGWMFEQRSMEDSAFSKLAEAADHFERLAHSYSDLLWTYSSSGTTSVENNTMNSLLQNASWQLESVAPFVRSGFRADVPDPNLNPYPVVNGMDLNAIYEVAVAILDSLD